MKEEVLVSANANIPPSRTDAPFISESDSVQSCKDSGSRGGGYVKLGYIVSLGRYDDWHDRQTITLYRETLEG